MCACSDIVKVCMKWLLTFIKFECGGKFSLSIRRGGVGTRLCNHITYCKEINITVHIAHIYIGLGTQLKWSDTGMESKQN